MAELATLFALSFAAATLVPLPSEASLFAYVHVYPDRAAVAVAVATVGNTAGGMTSYGIGRLIPPRHVSARAIEWLPVLGDALCVAAGWLRLHWAAVLAFMAAGRLARYIVVASLA